jgi:hypothetical protein
LVKNQNVMSKKFPSFIVSVCLFAVLGLYVYVSISNRTEENSKSVNSHWSTKKSKVKSGKDAYMKPDGFIEYFNSISKSCAVAYSNNSCS